MSERLNLTKTKKTKRHQQRNESNRALFYPGRAGRWPRQAMPHAPDPGASHSGEMSQCPRRCSLGSKTPAPKGVKNSGQGLPQWQCSFKIQIHSKVLPSWP